MHQASRTQNKCPKKSSLLRGRNGIVWYTLLSIPSGPLYPVLLVHFCHRCLSHPYHCLTEEDSPYLCNIHHWAAHGLYAVTADPWVPALPGHLWWGPLWWNINVNICQHVENCGKPRSLHPTRVPLECKSKKWPVTHSPRNLDRTRETKAHNSSDTSRSLLKAIQLQNSQRQWIFQGVIMVALTDK